jgi:hypothetical protein
MSAKDIIIFSFFLQKVTTKYMSYFAMFNEKVLTKQLANDESRTIKRSGGTSTTSVDCTRCKLLAMFRTEYQIGRAIFISASGIGCPSAASVREPPNPIYHHHTINMERVSLF